MADNQACPECLAEMPADHQFCGSCGAKMSLSEERHWALRLLSPAGEVEETLPVQVANAVIGRSQSADLQLSGDPTLSLQHARLRVEGGSLRVEDLGAMNGIFRPVLEPTPLRHNAVIRAGGQWLRFQLLSSVGRSPIVPSPMPAYGPYTVPWGRLLRYGHHGKVTTARLIYGEEFVVGRSRGQMIISKAATLSSSHFVLRLDEDDMVLLEDLGSRNGTFVQVDRGRTISAGDCLLLGERLVRFDAMERGEMRSAMEKSQPPEAAAVDGEQPPLDQVPPALAVEDAPPPLDASIEPALADAGDEDLMPAEPEAEFTNPATIPPEDLPAEELNADLDDALGPSKKEDLDSLLAGLPALDGD